MKYYLIMGLLTFFGITSAQDTNFQHSLTTKAAPAALWSIWTDVNQWDTWDIGLKKAALEGPFELGATGTITSLQGQRSKFKVIELDEGKSYTIQTKLPLGSLCIRRSYEIVSGETVFTHQVWFKGLTKGLFAKMLGREFRAMLPEAMQNIKTQLETAD